MHEGFTPHSDLHKSQFECARFTAIRWTHAKPTYISSLDGYLVVVFHHSIHLGRTCVSTIEMTYSNVFNWMRRTPHNCCHTNLIWILLYYIWFGRIYVWGRFHPLFSAHKRSHSFLCYLSLWELLSARLKCRLVFRLEHFCPFPGIEYPICYWQLTFCDLWCSCIYFWSEDEVRDHAGVDIINKHFTVD